ncbi:YqjF family protein [Haliscomenobacter hydrossis]|uniref:DUF2071 domain-containing protein n=1 Tax=Haliscomenobacter hydrossis (strain ATCC 27775 / DSM 1100 / LMG 10767 / O) TaxID=760192 RepID=F4L592_HALH1|nr:DUF2071 domain-containing protein [Haliscomenobacter hydrossis]AEE49772.1 Protein of unknown function DUF2071 [Haliscomenobacter hydrossis DSM 1100]
MQNPFLTAQWRRLLMLNYAIEPDVLLPYLPAGVELDWWNDTCYVSLVGFRFVDTRVMGMGFPGHRNFPEINLRFYVRYRDPELGWKRGVVFLRELVPVPTITWVANALYRERYKTVPMQYRWEESKDQLEVEYSWKQKGRQHLFSAITSAEALDMPPGGEAEFITEHYWGYARWDAQRTMEYAVEHPRWQTYAVQDVNCAVDFGAAYGAEFAFLNGLAPKSVFLAEGSEIAVGKGHFIR